MSAGRFSWVGVLALAALGSWGCDDDEVPPVPPIVLDDEGVVVLPPLDEGTRPDMTVEADAGASDGGPQPVACTWPSECPGGDCVDGACIYGEPEICFMDAPCPEGEVCGGAGTWRWRCVLPCEQDGTCALRPRACEAPEGCPPGSNCKEGRCINNCVLDSDCPEGGHCIDGECLPYPDLLNGDAPTPLGQPGQLVAGVGVAPLDFPVGVSMAGYGARQGPQTPYNKALGGSDRVFDAQDARVLVLSTDASLLIVLRLPLGWSTDYLRTLIATKVQALTVDADHPNGINYIDSLVTVATHSHSGPGRFWNLLPGTGLGVFGHGEFSREMIERYTSSFAVAIVEALAAVQPARFGYTVIDDFDPERHIHSDRRGESPPFLDDRLMVWRVEDLDGRPMMGAVNFALHGTHMNHPWVTGDVAGGIETVATERLSAEAGRYVPVMFLNGNAGNVSPRGDAATVVDWGKVQTLGHLMWPVFRAAWDAAEPKADVDLKVVNRRIPIDYDLLGYDRTVPDFRTPGGKPYEYGGFSCVPDGRGPDEEPWMDGDLGCRLDLQTFLHHPAVQAHKTALTAIRIDDLVVTTLPGEPTSELGMLLAEGVEADAAAAGRPEVRALNFGYAQDHQLYLVTPEDWFRGGYEASQNWFGWNLGVYIAGEARSLAGELFTETREPNDGAIKPTWWPALTDDTVTPTTSAGPAGEVLDAPPAEVRRGALVELRWTGGHPGVDLPRVVLERQDGGGFTPMERSAGVPYDDAGFESLKLYEGDYGDDHTWAVRWEFPFDFPTGTYRLVATGQALGASEAEPYTAASTPFEVQPARLAVRAAGLGEAETSVTVTYPDGPTNDRGDNVFDGLTPAGHLLRVDPSWRLDGAQKRWSFVLGPPLDDRRVTVRRGDEVFEVEAEPVTVDRVLVVARDAAGVERTETIADWPAHRITVPGGCETVEDRFGNRAACPVLPELD